MTWRKVDPYHMRNGDWTIDKAINVTYPYGLYHQKIYHGHYKTFDEAKQEYERLVKG
jgi:hypothetical protein